MGIAAATTRNNGLIDLFVTDFGDDYKVALHNDGDASFTDVSYKAGIAQTTIPFVGWGDGSSTTTTTAGGSFMVAGHVYSQVTSTNGALRLPSVRCCSQRPRERFTNVPAVKGSGAVVTPARERPLATVQRRQDRCDHQSDRWAPTLLRMSIRIIINGSNCGWSGTKSRATRPAQRFT